MKNSNRRHIQSMHMIGKENQMPLIRLRWIFLAITVMVTMLIVLPETDSKQIYICKTK